MITARLSPIFAETGSRAWPQRSRKRRRFSSCSRKCRITCAITSGGGPLFPLVFIAARSAIGGRVDVAEFEYRQLNLRSLPFLVRGLGEERDLAKARVVRSRGRRRSLVSN